MVSEYRQDFNARFTPEKYQQFLETLYERCGTRVDFRNCETPCFFPRALLDKMARYGSEITHQLMENADYLAAARDQIPPAYRVPGENARPLFIQADFGLNENHEPVLVEIQGFPSLYAYQPVLAETYRDIYGLADDLDSLLGGLTQSQYNAQLRAAIVGDHEAENVVLLEIEPQTQKTLPDFLLTEVLCGVAPVCITDVKQQGNRLFYERNGKRIPIDRLYNRVIVDELVRKNVQTPFDFRDELDVEWAGHPNWYFNVSKFSLPYLQHECVPETRFLSDVGELPTDLENYVLKPLYSFAGLGVQVGPTRADVEAVADKTQWILQKRVNFVPVVETPHGPTKVEIRIMYVWPENGELRPMTALTRLGRGKMMGVDQNRNQEWVGGSAAFAV